MIKIQQIHNDVTKIDFEFFSIKIQKVCLQIIRMMKHLKVLFVSILIPFENAFELPQNLKLILTFLWFCLSWPLLLKDEKSLVSLFLRFDKRLQAVGNISSFLWLCFFWRWKFNLNSFSRNLANFRVYANCFLLQLFSVFHIQIYNISAFLI